MSPFVSVVVVSYDIPRELPRTLATLAPRYQRGVEAGDYEVIVVDNGSPVPVDVGGLGDLDIRVVQHRTGSPSPAGAVNAGIEASFGRYVGVFIDGARMLSPGLLANARSALLLDERAIVATRGRYLGHQMQRDAALLGYDQVAEDLLLASVDWESNGDTLFEISVFDESSGPTWFTPIAESNGLFMSRTLWAELGGYDTAFTMPGGGLVNLDTWRRACSLPDTRIVELLGEATFHQYHGGVATNGSLDVIEAFNVDYERIRARYYERPEVQVTYFGSFRIEPPMNELLERRRRSRTAAPLAPLRPDVERIVARLPGGTRHVATRAARAAGMIRRRELRAELSRRRQEHEHADLVRSSEFFDVDWYVSRYPDVASSGIDPALYSVRYGAASGHAPGPAFDAVWYLDHHVDVDDAGWDPLVHYLLHGRAEGREIRRFDLDDPVLQSADRDLLRASDLWDPQWYLEYYPAVRETGMDALDHYVSFGARRCYHPSQEFDAVDYVTRNLHDPVVASRPLIHYIQVGRACDMSIRPVGGYGRHEREMDEQLVAASGVFDAHWYSERYPTVSESGFDPIPHYLLFGWRRGWSPGPGFDAERYVTVYPDVKEAGLNPLLHYLRCGRDEGRHSFGVKSP